MKNSSAPLFGAAAAALSAAGVAGVALWITRASFDVAGTTHAPVRVAMLPSIAELIGFIAMTLLIAAGLAAVLRALGDPKQGFWAASGEALLPLFTLALLLLPYLPWLADWIPALRLLAGPGRFFIWVVVLGQVMWMLLPHVSPSRAGAVFGVASVAVSAPFLLNISHFPIAFISVFETLRRLPGTDWSSVPAGSLGVLFDQEYGLIPFAPVLLLGFIGLGGMLREPSHRRGAIALGASSLLLIVLSGTLNRWWSKTAMPGEQLLLMIPLLAWPIAWLYPRLPAGSLSRSGAHVLLLTSAAITLAIILEIAPVRQEADGTSALLQWMSPAWRLWSEVPSYVENRVGDAAARTAVWLLGGGLLAWLFTRRIDLSPGRSALAANASITLFCLGLVSVTSVVMTERTDRFDVERRVRFDLLETFDLIARPIAIRYDPLSKVSAAELPALFTASAVPGERTDPQPLRVVLNARFRLPAGRYVVDLKGSDRAGSVPKGSMSLQIGREGRALESWPLVLGPGERIERDFEVPLDAEFVGFRAARQVEPAIAELRVSARDVVDTRKRFPAGTVLSAAAFPPVRVFFHDNFSYPEPKGFWVQGRTTARMTVLKVRENDTGILLALHGGAKANVVTLSTPGWSQKLDLVPGVTERVVVPSREGDRFVPLTVASADGFVPAEHEQSRDRRFLGAWVAFIPDDIARTSAAP